MKIENFFITKKNFLNFFILIKLIKISFLICQKIFLSKNEKKLWYFQKIFKISIIKNFGGTRSWVFKAKKKSVEEKYTRIFAQFS